MQTKITNESTYRELFGYFKWRNKDLAPLINDYRPAGEYKMQIWLKNGYTFYAQWRKKQEKFEISGFKRGE